MEDPLMPSFQRISSYRLQHLLLWEWDLEIDDSTLGIVVISGNFPRYWVVGIPYCLQLDGFFKCLTSIPFIHTY